MGNEYGMAHPHEGESDEGWPSFLTQCWRASYYASVSSKLWRRLFSLEARVFVSYAVFRQAGGSVGFAILTRSESSNYCPLRQGRGSIRRGGRILALWTRWRRHHQIPAEQRERCGMTELYSSGSHR
jgi:hypothetical protein